jgi:HNH endonuclease
MTPKEYSAMPEGDNKLAVRLAITQADALANFRYEDGKLYWLRAPSKNTPAGAEAGTLRVDGYRRILFRYKRHYTHRLIYLMHHGEFDGEIDHIDCDKSNNKIENLRLATRGENTRNIKIPRDNTSGAKGVSFTSGKYRAKIKVNNKQIHIGSFNSMHEASQAYASASKKYHGEFGRLQ